jgi:D-arabinose 1-dehydrogenase-like Zn-dependent alcohol dehydrogenase
MRSSPKVCLSSSAHSRGSDELRHAGKIRAVVDSIYPLEKTLDAYERLLTKRARGKVVVRIRSDA